MVEHPCRLCGAQTLSFLYSVNQCAIERCSACGFVQVKDTPADEAFATQYAPSYFERGKYQDRLAQEKEYQKRVALLVAAGLPEGARVLDAGCATGDFIEYVGDRYDMWGLDISDHAIEIAKQKNPHRSAQLFAGTVEDSNFQPGSFDAIVMWDVVEHIRNPVEACRHLVKFLRPGGLLFLSTPDIGAPTARVMQRYWAFMTPPEHLGFFNHRSLTRLLEKDLGLQSERLFSTGKWVNVAFLIYKLRRVMPALVPQFVAKGIRKTPLARAMVYVPTGDIQYAVARKPLASASDNWN